MPRKYDEQTRAKAVRLVTEHREDYSSEYEAIKTVAGRLGMNLETVQFCVAGDRVSRRNGIGLRPVGATHAVEHGLALRAEAVLARPHRDDLDVRLRLVLVSALSLQNRGSDLIHRSEQMLALHPGLPAADQALVLAQEALGRIFSDDNSGGEATARRALALAESSSDVAMTVWSLTTMSVAVKSQGRYAEALALTGRAHSLVINTGDRPARLRHPLFFLGMALSDADLVGDAQAAYRQALEEYDELGSTWLVGDTLLMVAISQFLTGAGTTPWLAWRPACGSRRSGVWGSSSARRGPTRPSSPLRGVIYPLPSGLWHAWSDPSTGPSRAGEPE